MRSRKRRRGLQLDITPLVDTVFNLMIFFALSLNFLAVPGLRVNLPKAAAQTEAQEKDKITVAVTKEGRLFLDEEPLALAQLEARLRQQARTNPDTLVIMRADEEALHGRVVEVMDLAQTAGLHRLAIATRPKEH